MTGSPCALRQQLTLLRDPAPSRQALSEWLREQSVTIHDAVEIAEMEDGEGWRLITNRDLDIGEVLCKIPKTSILSVRTSSLPPIPADTANGIATNHTILHLALALLHEFRLAQESPFWGYLQSLPRETVLVPLVWEFEGIGGEDGRLGLEWLRGTEAEKDLKHKEAEGLSLQDIQAFYIATSYILPPTSSHPTPSPFLAFLHAYSLISTRAFIIDLYHLIALTPFCDILNHLSSSHTSLQSDDFVCHKCGSLRTCQHDIPSISGVTLRLQHLGEGDRRRLEKEEDTVDMIIEKEVKKGEEVFNSYGEDLGDARLLVEWGFIGGDFAGKGLTWEVEDLGDDTDILGMWEELVKRNLVTESGDDNTEEDYDDSDRLFALDTEQNAGTLALDNNGRIRTSLFALLYLVQVKSNKESKDLNISQITPECKAGMEALENAWATIEDGQSRPLVLGQSTQLTAQQLVDLLEDRLSRLHRADLDQEELFRLRDALRPEDKLQQMAMTLALNERILLETTRDRWVQLLTIDLG